MMTIGSLLDPVQAQNMSWRVTWFVVVISMLSITITDTCFIRNCPLGGKRSYSDRGNSWSSKRQCMQCGPEGLGQCIGPNICCGPDIGCFINTAETQVCAREDENPIPCDVTGEVCGTHSDGHCATNGVCCSDEKCTLDAVCDESRDYTGKDDIKTRTQPSSHFSSGQFDILSPSLENYIRRLLRIREAQKK